MAIPFATSEVVTAAELNELARAHWRKTTAKQVVNSIAETDLLNGEVTIDAGAMSTNRAIRLTAWGDSINNTGAAVATPRFKLKLGATTLLDTNVIAASWGANAARFGWRIVAEIQNLGAANSQWSMLTMEFTGQVVVGTAAFTTGAGTYTGPVAGTTFFKALGGNSSAVDTTAAQALALTVTLATASASEDVTLKAALVEVV